MLPVGERERYELVEDLFLSKKQEDKQQKNLPFMPQTHHDHGTVCPQNGFWLQFTPIYLLGKENGMQMVRGWCAAATTKEKIARHNLPSTLW